MLCGEWCAFQCSMRKKSGPLPARGRVPRVKIVVDSSTATLVDRRRPTQNQIRYLNQKRSGGTLHCIIYMCVLWCVARAAHTRADDTTRSKRSLPLFPGRRARGSRRVQLRCVQRTHVTTVQPATLPQVAALPGHARAARACPPRCRPSPRRAKSGAWGPGVARVGGRRAWSLRLKPAP